MSENRHLKAEVGEQVKGRTDMPQADTTNLVVLNPDGKVIYTNRGDRDVWTMRYERP